MNDRGLRFGEIRTRSSGCVCRQREFQRGRCHSRRHARLELREIVPATSVAKYQIPEVRGQKSEERGIFKQTPNAERRTPKAFASRHPTEETAGKGHREENRGQSLVSRNIYGPCTGKFMLRA